MDEKIRHLKKATQNLEKQENALLKIDKKNDKKINKAEKIIKKKKK